MHNLSPDLMVMYNGNFGSRDDFIKFINNLPKPKKYRITNNTVFFNKSLLPINQKNIDLFRKSFNPRQLAVIDHPSYLNKDVIRNLYPKSALNSYFHHLPSYMNTGRLSHGNFSKKNVKLLNNFEHVVNETRLLSNRFGYNTLSVNNIGNALNPTFYNNDVNITPKPRKYRPENPNIYNYNSNYNYNYRRNNNNNNNNYRRIA